MKTIASLALLLLVVLATPTSAEPKVDRRSVNGLTFALPAGWTFKLEPGADHAMIQNVVDQRYCLISVYEPRAAGPDLEAEFAIEWKSLSKPNGTDVAPPLPATTRRKIGTRTVVEGSAATIADRQAVLRQIIVLDVGGQIATLVLTLPDARAAAAYKADIDGMLASIEAAPRQTTARSAGAGVALASVTLADLVGVWDETRGSTSDWFDSATGQYKRSTTTFYGASHSIAADGTFKYLFVGRSDSHTVKEGDHGTVSITDGFLVIRYKERTVDAVRERRIIGFVTLPDGTSLMVTVDRHTTQKEVRWTDADYLSEFCGAVIAGAYTSCVGGETWIRRPSKAK